VRARTRARAGRRLALAAGMAVAVVVALFVIGRVHAPNESMALFGRRGVDAIRLKAQLATAVLMLALVQLTSALWIYHRLPGVGRARPPVRTLHRVVGVVLFLLSVPVAVQCILAYGVQLNGLRVAVHSLAGLFFYGAFAAKMLIVRSARLPGWTLPIAGGSLVTLVVVIWYSGALWYFAGFDLPVP
jgi:Family of unknown function (DUF6529)